MKVIMKGMCNGTSFTVDKIVVGNRTRDRQNSRPALNPLSYENPQLAIDPLRKGFAIE